MNFEDLKLYTINFLTISLSFSQLESSLRLILLFVSILFTYEKWKTTRNTNKIYDNN